MSSSIGIIEIAAAILIVFLIAGALVAVFSRKK